MIVNGTKDPVRVFSACVNQETVRSDSTKTFFRRGRALKINDTLHYYYRLAAARPTLGQAARVRLSTLFEVNAFIFLAVSETLGWADHLSKVTLVLAGAILPALYSALRQASPAGFWSFH